MSIRIVTGRTGEPHVTSYQMQSLYRGLFGDQALLNVGDRFEATVLDNNNIYIGSGVLLVQGIYAIIPFEDYDIVQIRNVTPGYKRCDVICLEYRRNTAEDTESVSLVVFSSNETEGTPPVPIIASGDRWEYDAVVRVPLYRVLVELDSLTVTKEPILKNPYPTIPEVFQSVSNGKVAIASAITDKGVSTDATATFTQMAQNIERIQSGNGVVWNEINYDYELVSYEEVSE